MTGDQGAPDLGAEREIDLRGWLDAFRSRWPIAVAGLVIGVVVGVLYSLTGGSTYTASALIAPGQAFNPAGNAAVLTYLTSQTAINTIATSAGHDRGGGREGRDRSRRAAAAMSASPASTRTPARAPAPSAPGQAAVLVAITVQQNSAKKAEDAADAVARIVQARTTIAVRRPVAPHQRRTPAELHQTARDAEAEDHVPDEGAQSTGRSASITGLLLTIQLDEAQATYGQTQDAQLTTQQAQSLAEHVEKTQIIQLAKAQKSTARSRRNSVLFGGLIGLVVGSIVALIVGLRAARTAPAPATA